MTAPFHFAYQRTSWDDDKDCVRPGSASDLICREIQRHMPDGSYSVGREPLPDRINIYTSTRPAFNADVRDSERLSILLGHGCADKNIWTRHSPEFDHVITPGPMHTDLVMRGGVPASRIFEGGYPKLDPIYNGEIQAAPIEQPIVLWAPTHGGGGDMLHFDDKTPPRGVLATKRTSWWRRDELLRTLNNKAWQVVECPHPRYTPGHTATLTQYVGAHACVADGGSTLIEAMLLGIPVVVPAWITGAGHRATSTLEGMLYHTRTPRVCAQPRYMASLIREAIADGPTQAEHDLSTRVLPTHMRGVSGKAQAEWLMSIA